jgi:hypothetical protein
MMREAGKTFGADSSLTITDLADGLWGTAEVLAADVCHSNAVRTHQ